MATPPCRRSIPGRLSLGGLDLSTYEMSGRAANSARHPGMGRATVDLGMVFCSATSLGLAAEGHVAVVVMYHIVGMAGRLGSDPGSGWCLRRSEARPSPLPELAVRMRLRAVAAGWLQGEALERQVAYWKARLAGAGGARAAVRPAAGVGAALPGRGRSILLPAVLTGGWTRWRAARARAVHGALRRSSCSVRWTRTKRHCGRVAGCGRPIGAKG